MTDMISTSDMNQERLEPKAGQELRAGLPRWSIEILANNCETGTAITGAIFVTRKCFRFSLFSLVARALNYTRLVTCKKNMNLQIVCSFCTCYIES